MDDDLTAYECFWHDVEQGGRVPVAFPFSTIDGDSGLACGSIQVEAGEAVYNDSCEDRAVYAILAINQSMQGLLRSDETIKLVG